MPPELNTSEQSPIRMLAFGAGALGTYIAGSLALHGHRIVFLERPEIVSELRKSGLHLTIKEQTRDLTEPVLTASLAEALEQGPFDIALFALKSFDTLAALESMTPYLDTLPPILCLQNGVENELLLAERLGEERVIPGTVTSAVGRRGVGNVVLERLRGVGIWAGHPFSAQLTEAFNHSGLNARMYAHSEDMKWSKMLTNLLANASSAILDMTPGEIFAQPQLFRLEVEQLRETLRVMEAHKYHVVDLPGTPIRALAFSVRGLPSGLSRNLLKSAVGGGRGGKMPSFHIDLHSGRGLSEVEYLNGAVVRFGERAGIPTPVNRFLNETLLALTNGSIPLEAFARQPEKFIDKFKRNYQSG
ncbi:MAG TPA: ketopantoate reductase family protein [Anaerolineales bacterium]|nr:ketopantoate reductase family protein [Anaerolineales bacterium]